ncbi:MAG: PD-(D/E)XK nuclease family protein [Candidatus Thermoplasmatota archaeon]|nr:PD-(D/E)XK nuclease family protein [Candidatus Thermoplasmatota archaeon]
MEPTLTLEHIPPGQFPDWLFEQLCEQVVDPRLEPILVIHSSEAARAEILHRLESANIGPIDRSRHHTVSSLRKSLHADLRLPRLLPLNAKGHRLLHAECELAAKRGEFPLLHPTPEHRWGEGRTRALAKLAQVFDIEDVRNWDGPGLVGFNNCLKQMGQKLNGLHPLLQRQRLIDELEKTESTPFTLTGIIGIVLMDQMPTLSKSDRRLLLNLNRFTDVHQLCQHGEAPIGNHRLGLHGAILEDVHPCTEETCPRWLRSHEIWDPTPCSHSVTRLLVPTNGLDIAATVELLRDWSDSAKPESTVAIIDPGKEVRLDQWNRALTEIGLRPSNPQSTLKSSSPIHWLGEIVSIGLGSEAWSMSRIRGIGTQRSLRFDDEWLQTDVHPSQTNWAPEMDALRIESLARSWHILGGYGALSRWLHALSSPSHPAPWQDSDEAGMKAECTQWWVLCLLRRLSPLLSSGERALLDEPDLLIGCHTGENLPLPPSPTNGDECLVQLMAHLDESSMIFDMAPLKLLMEEHDKFRASQTILNHPLALLGSQWVEGLLGLIDDLPSPEKFNASDNIRILSPAESLGISADIIVLTHMTASNWSLRADKLPWLSEANCKELDLARADSPLRDARHSLHHLIHASPNVILLDPTGLDEDCQPATPLAEWLATYSGSDTPEEVPRPHFLHSWATSSSVRTRGHHLAWYPSTVSMVEESGTTRAELDISGRGFRDERQRTGQSLLKSKLPDSPPLNPHAITVPMDSELMRDRLRRQPTEVQSGDEYIGMDMHNRFISIGDLKIIPGSKGAPGETTPRDAENWPVLGGKLGRNQLLAIDPRPLRPRQTSLPIFDKRNGYSTEAGHARRSWSASRLQRWQACPRQGWLERRLNAGRMEQQEDDLDARIRGDIVHNSLGRLFEQVFSLGEGEVRASDGSTSLANCGQTMEDMFGYILDYVAEYAPWLERDDATATQRRYDLIGLSKQAWLDWLASSDSGVLSPTGRLGNMLQAEMDLYNSIPISLEWSLNRMEISHPDGRTLSLTGFIDRVDVINHPDLEDGDDSIAPLDWNPSSEWKPKRLILIRDIKSVDGPSKQKFGERHRKAIFDELQLGLYARCWEIAHPGDLVIGVGISEVGNMTTHSIEISPAFEELFDENGIGELTNYTHETHRLPDEDSDAESDPFRAWMAERLTTAFDVAKAADSGLVHATPEESTCTWCRVKEACGLAPIVGGDSSWN